MRSIYYTILNVFSVESCFCLEENVEPRDSQVFSLGLVSPLDHQR